MSHEPADRLFDAPALGRVDEFTVLLRTLDALNLRQMLPVLDTSPQVLDGIATIGPNAAQQREPVADLIQDRLPSREFRASGGRHEHPQRQTERVHLYVAVAPPDAPADIIPDLVPVPIRLDVLAVQDRRAGLQVAIPVALQFANTR